MNIDALQTFVAIADAGGISSAALRLARSKSIVSRRLSRLEAALSIELLARTTRGAALTEAGTMLCEHAARACAKESADTDRPAGRLFRPGPCRRSGLRNIVALGPALPVDPVTVYFHAPSTSRRAI